MIVLSFSLFSFIKLLFFFFLSFPVPDFPFSVLNKWCLKPFLAFHFLLFPSSFPHFYPFNIFDKSPFFVDSRIPYLQQICPLRYKFIQYDYILLIPQLFSVDLESTNTLLFIHFFKRFILFLSFLVNSFVYSLDSSHIFIDYLLPPPAPYPPEISLHPFNSPTFFFLPVPKEGIVLKFVYSFFF